MEAQPTIVPQATQVGDVRGRWAWAEPSVWTERRLTALEEGVKGGVWFSLIDKVYAKGNLVQATTKVCANRGAAGVDHVSRHGEDERRWPNAFFAEQGLFSLKAAHAKYVNPL